MSAHTDFRKAFQLSYSTARTSRTKFSRAIMGEWRRKEDEDRGGMHFASGQPLNKTGIVAGADKKFYGSCWLIFAALEIAPVFSFSLPPPFSLPLSPALHCALYEMSYTYPDLRVGVSRASASARAFFAQLNSMTYALRAILRTRDLTLCRPVISSRNRPVQPAIFPQLNTK